ncbi:MAG: hypothetical protein ROO76_10585 [Terriglobia bacterium]|nr:hypothetical protein [Terriglobia bacterium]
MTKVAERFGVSDVALAKTCRKLKVPVPGRGYWAKKANGHPTHKEPFRELKNLPQVAKPQPVQKRVFEPSNEEDRKYFDQIEGKLSSGALAPSRSSGVKRSPLVVFTEKEGRKAKEDRRRVLDLPSGCLSMRVSKTSFNRALAIMADVIDICEANSMPVTVDEHGTSTQFLGERVRFKITEKMDQFELPPGARGKYEYGPTFAGKPVDYSASGYLSLEIDEYTDLRKNWRDAKGRQLEDAIPEFIAGVMKSAVVLHRRTEQRNVEEMERQRRAAELQQLRAEYKAEKQRVEDLIAMGENWRLARTLREFLAVCKEEAAKADPAQPREEFDKWFKWRSSKLIAWIR